MKNLILKELKHMIAIKETYPVQKIGAKYWKELSRMSSIDRDYILKESGKTVNMGIELKKGMAVGEFLDK